MASIISKRQQARNERMLQDLVKSVTGNDRCADCAARNPAWASWSLGIFLCMSCAALHRKMGTHISKVKSLTMDSWTPEQVDNMKRIGNVISNRAFNPQNIRPDIPTDADEVGGVMERFIRQKYEQKAFLASRARSHTTGGASISSSEGIPPPLPPKPTKKFGFSLRSSSATQPKYTPPLSPALTGSDGRATPPMGRMNKPSRVFGSAVGNQEEDTFDTKLASLREMGFSDTRRNSMVLKSVNGSLEKAIETLVRLGDSTTGAQGTLTPMSANSSNNNNANGIHVERQRPRQDQPASSMNPFDALDLQAPQRAATQPLPSTALPPQASYNPFLQPSTQLQPQPQPQPPLQDAFSAMQISSTQPQQFQNNPFMPQHMQQQTYPPPAMHQAQAQPPSNPFLRKTQSQTFTPSNPFGLQQQQPVPTQAPQNPWLSQPQVQTPQAYPSSASYQPQHDFFASQPQPQYQQHQSFQQPQPLQPQHTTNPYQQQQAAQQQPTNPFQIPPPQPTQPEPHQSYQSPHQQTPQQLYPQPTGRFDKTSILALYNHPQLAPSRPLQPLPENGIPDQQTTPQRSVTMPSFAVSAGTGSMNPFSQQAVPGARHVSQESRDFVGLGGASGRQSPDAFSGLSARFAR